MLKYKYLLQEMSMKMEPGACFIAPTGVELDYAGEHARCFVYVRNGKACSVSAYRSLMIADAIVLELLMPNDIQKDDILRVVQITGTAVFTEIVGHRTYQERRQGWGSASGRRWTVTVDLVGKDERGIGDTKLVHFGFNITEANRRM